tara:strand:+ start:315 stop:1988 length:1674 start_codon:yes stop_codon:yes gene_type:complete
MKNTIIKELKKHIKLKKEKIESLLEIPPNSELGDYAFPCFILAKKLKKNPLEISSELAEKIKPNKEISEVKAVGPYLNFFVNKKILAEQVIKDILKNENYGKQKQNKKIIIDFSQANTHKAFHVGHIRGTSLGESISRILEFSGNKIIRANYQGDTGMHVAKWIWNYSQNHKNEKLKADESWIASIYVDSIKRLANDKTEKLQQQVEEVNRKLESGKDKELNSLWKKTRDFSLKSFETIYKQLDTRFDKYYFESQVEKKAKLISLDLLKKKIAVKSEEAVIMNLEKYNLGVWVLLRKDGTVLYSAKDLSLIEKRFQDYKLDKCIYVVADSQSLHFKQLFKTLELMKNKNFKKCKHIPFSLVRLPSGKMSSRTGENILYSDFIKEIKEHAKKQIKKRTKLSKKESDDRALIISISAIKYSFLKQDTNKVIVFDKQEALNFEGNTGPYLLYSYARASSILRKSKKKSEIKITDLSNSEIELIKKLSQFPEIIGKATQQLNPALIANYSYDLSKLFNEFYHSNKVIGSESESFRLSLIQAFRKILKQSLNLLGIEVLEEM